MALTVTGIKNRFLTEFGTSVDPATQDDVMNKYAQAIFNVLTGGVTTASRVVGLPNFGGPISEATGVIAAALPTFVAAFIASFTPAQNQPVSDLVSTQYATALFKIMTLDAQTVYPTILAGPTAQPATLIPPTVPAIVTQLQNSFGAAQDSAQQTVSLTKFANALSVCLLSCTSAVLVSTGIGNITASGQVR